MLFLTYGNLELLRARPLKGEDIKAFLPWTIEIDECDDVELLRLAHETLVAKHVALKLRGEELWQLRWKIGCLARKLNGR